MRSSGIYIIQSISKPDRCYIGSAINLRKRWWNHRHSLKKGNHHSIILQRHCNKYGIDDLEFHVLLRCETVDLIKIEQYYMDMYNPYFNIVMIAGRGNGMLGKHHTEEAKLKSSLSHKGQKTWNTGTKGMGLTTSWNKTKILQFTREGVFIREWESAYAVQKELNILSANISHCLKNRRLTAGGFKWGYKLVS